MDSVMGETARSCEGLLGIINASLHLITRNSVYHTTLKVLLSQQCALVNVFEYGEVSHV